MKGAWHNEVGPGEGDRPTPTPRVLAASQRGAVIGRTRGCVLPCMQFEGHPVRVARPQLLATRWDGSCMLYGSGEQGAGKGKAFRASAGRGSRCCGGSTEAAWQGRGGRAGLLLGCSRVADRCGTALDASPFSTRVWARRLALLRGTRGYCGARETRNTFTWPKGIQHTCGCGVRGAELQITNKGIQVQLAAPTLSVLPLKVSA